MKQYRFGKHPQIEWIPIETNEAFERYQEMQDVFGGHGGANQFTWGHHPNSQPPHHLFQERVFKKNLRKDISIFQKMIVFRFLFNLENAKTIDYERLTP